MKYSHHIRLAGTVTVGPKGQVVIPSEVRDQMSIRPGDKLVALYIDTKKSITFLTEQQAEQYVEQMGRHCTYFKEPLEKRES